MRHGHGTSQVGLKEIVCMLHEKECSGILSEFEGYPSVKHICYILNLNVVIVQHEAMPLRLRK